MCRQLKIHYGILENIIFMWISVCFRHFLDVDLSSFSTIFFSMLFSLSTFSLLYWSVFIFKLSIVYMQYCCIHYSCNWHFLFYHDFYSILGCCQVISRCWNAFRRSECSSFVLCCSVLFCCSALVEVRSTLTNNDHSWSWISM